MYEGIWSQTEVSTIIYMYTKRGTYVYFFSENITIDSGGVLTANGLGYELADGDRTDSSGNVRKGLHGVINPGLGYTSSLGASGDLKFCSFLTI
jgi:hypothetical protein